MARIRMTFEHIGPKPPRCAAELTPRTKKCQCGECHSKKTMATRTFSVTSSGLVSDLILGSQKVTGNVLVSFFLKTLRTSSSLTPWIHIPSEKVIGDGLLCRCQESPAVPNLRYGGSGFVGI